ncbi:MAG: DNA processing protein DprA, partial [Actinomycetota bacterium]|nr:DNA processing protein DprA [Actinomycetota bacterium]
MTAAASGDEDRLARIALARVVEPGSRAVARALESMPASEVWADLRRGVAPDRLGQQALAGIVSRTQGYDPRHDLDRLDSVGGRAVVPGDEEWPERLTWSIDAMSSGDVKEMAPPWALFVRGSRSLSEVVERSAAVVGARAAT